MTAVPFFTQQKSVPSAFDDARGQAFAESLEGHVLLADTTSATALTSLAGHSPFLARCMERDADALAELLKFSPDAAFEKLLSDTSAELAAINTAALAKPVLRRARRLVAQLIALADHSGQWTVEQVTGALTQFGDLAVSAAVSVLLREAQTKGKFKPVDEHDPARDCGIAVLAMGKFGAGELNYSSDIDIVIFFDRGKLGPLVEEPSKFAIKLTRDLVACLHEPTRDGYVFRIDLRLRPDAGSTQVAISFDAAENYYEGMGQNWERAAYIKARSVGGDIEAGNEMLKRLIPFIWRKYLDFASIEDIHSILRQIHSHGQHRRIAVEGHDVKLGLGGIREIEFFVQTQQLILGGREPELRGPRTVEMLAELQEQKSIEPDVAKDMTAAYRFLRHVEHRLQMVEDQQTHAMPKDEGGIARISSFSGFDDERVFRETLLGHLGNVHRHSRALFKESGELGDSSGSLVFTGVDDDPETLETLQRLGFDRVSDIAAAIRKWHHGRIRATRSARTRGRLTALMPELLRALSETADPDLAFWRFDDFLSGLPAGVQLFSMLTARPELLEFLAEVLGTAPRLSNYLARHPHVLDALLDPGFLETLPGPSEVDDAFYESINSSMDLEGVMNATRRLVRELGFRIGVQLLRGRASPADASDAYSSTAQAALNHILKAVSTEFEINHGKIDGGACAILALGRLGSGEMTATSDVDLIFVYDTPPNEAAGGEIRSDGARHLPATTYYTRLSQRLINAITAQTEEGKLFEVDMRLRPSGNKGPLGTKLAAFESYHADSAWTWERMALTRARVIAGPTDLKNKIEEVIFKTLTEPRDPRTTARDVAEMRVRLAAEYGTTNVWDVKQVRGGLVDLEFMVQGLQLLHGQSHPEVLGRSTGRALSRLMGAGAIAPADGLALEEALELYRGVDHVLRLAVDGAFDPAFAPVALKQLLARNSRGSFEDLEARLIGAETEVQRQFMALFGPSEEA